jgi:hypothetical protein
VGFGLVAIWQATQRGLPLATTDPALFLANAAVLANLGYYGGRLLHAHVEVRLTAKAPAAGRPPAPVPQGYRVWRRRGTPAAA